MLTTQILSFLAGGYIAGRIRSEWPELTTDQVEFRDGMHGLLVWALGVLIGGLLLASTVLSVAKGVPNTVLSAAVTTEPVEYQTDVLLRPRQPTQVGGGASAAAGATSTTLEFGRARAEISRIFSKNLGTGQLSEPDRVYIAQIISQYTGVAAPEAQARVTDAFAELMRSAKQAADKARQAGILTGLITGIGLLVALAAAWWAANRGGYHRDHTIHVRLFPHRQAGARV